MDGCLPAGAGEDASPLGLRPVGAAQHGEDPTHGGTPRKEAERKPRELAAGLWEENSERDGGERSSLRLCWPVGICGNQGSRAIYL
jgi:hypothetical protein